MSESATAYTGYYTPVTLRWNLGAVVPVGVLLYVPDLNFCEARVFYQEDERRQFCVDQILDRIEVMKKEKSLALHNIERWIATMAGEVQMPKLRTMRIVDPPERYLSKLLDEVLQERAESFDALKGKIYV